MRREEGEGRKEEEGIDVEDNDTPTTSTWTHTIRKLQQKWTPTNLS
jgi:hypothetical protein